MKLFHETESKYYELLTYLVNKKQSFSSQELNELAREYFDGETDYEVWDALFSKIEGQEILFTYEDDMYCTIPESDIPVRNTKIENQALNNLIHNKYIKYFVQEKTVQKLTDKLKDIDVEWDETIINIKRKQGMKRDVSTLHLNANIKLILEAMRKEQAITYINTLRDGTIFSNALVYPVKIEYSLQKDLFRISAYEPKEDRFIRMDLETMSDIHILDEHLNGVGEKYLGFTKDNTRTVILDVEPIDYVVERCFRLFSYYDRKARYNPIEKRYQLEIEYLKFDEGEIIRNILSFGDSVMVISPDDVRMKVFDRIKKAYEVYEM